jgi:hypothetical protein
MLGSQEERQGSSVQLLQTNVLSLGYYWPCKLLLDVKVTSQ